MVRELTPNLKLIVESDDELVDQHEYNWTILDSKADMLIVADGVTPLDSDLWDGRIVAETTTGKVRIARANSAGSFDWQWLYYPFRMECTSTPALASSAFTERFFNGVDPTGINPTALVGGRAIVPISGIYSIWCRLDAPPPGGGATCLLYKQLYNGAEDSGTERGFIMNQSNTTGIITNWVKSMDAGTSCSYAIASLGQNVPNASVRWGISLIAPRGTVQ